MNSSINGDVEPKEWADFLRLGIKSIDLQHAKFFKLIEELQVYYTNNEDNLIVNEIITELEAYVEYHFKTEENMFKKSKFPETEQHIEQHNIFKEKVFEFRLAYQFQSTILSGQMLQFLRRWFIVHISEYDSKYVKYIRHTVTERKHEDLETN